MDSATVMKAYIRQLPKEELIELFMKTIKKEPEVVKIPLSIFKARLSSLELIVKYLKQELEWSNKKIALSILRSPQNVWITNRNADNKFPGRLNIQKSEHDLPVSIFADRKLSVLEAIVSYLIKQGLSYQEIAKHLNRSKRTIITVNHRAKKK